MVDDTTKTPVSSGPKRRGRPPGSGSLGVSRLQGARLPDAVVARLDRVLLHVFGYEVPHAARSELVRIAIEYGLQEIEYRVNSGLSVDGSPVRVTDELPERSPRSHVLRAFRLAGGAAEAEAARDKELRENASTRATKRARGALDKTPR